MQDLVLPVVSRGTYQKPFLSNIADRCHRARGRAQLCSQAVVVEIALAFSSVNVQDTVAT